MIAILHPLPNIAQGIMQPQGVGFKGIRRGRERKIIRTFKRLPSDAGIGELNLSLIFLVEHIGIGAGRIGFAWWVLGPKPGRGRAGAGGVFPFRLGR